MLAGNCLNNQLKQLNLITGTENFIVFKVNFVLTDSYLMVTGFYFKSHCCKDINDFTASIVSQVSRSKVKIATLIIHFKSRIAILIEFK